MMALDRKFEHLKIKLEAIKLATNNFSDRNCIGKGGFGKVYKGELILSKGHTVVALKQLDRKFGQGDPEFWKEIILLSLYKHENLVSLLGFCDDNGEKILVYEYASKRSLDNYLKSNDLTWVRRLNICIGAARGLAYLHNPGNTQQRVLHRDIKSSNILLDENWNARISDFGLSKLGPANQQFTFLVSAAVGTLGYCDPQYIETGLLTKESDVYSFGVVLFEVLCGRLCVDGNTKSPHTFTRLVQRSYEQNKVEEIIFSDMRNTVNPDSLKAFTAIAYQCLNMDYEQRPLMTEVVRDLEKALRYQVHGDDQLIDSCTFQENERDMNFGGLLDIEPHDLQFPFEPMKKTSITMQLKNKTDSHVAFKVKTTNPEVYAALPNMEILSPHSRCDIILTMQAQKEAPLDMKCNDKYLLQSTIVTAEIALKDITRELFNEESSNQVEDHVLDVNYSIPSKPLSPVREGSEEDLTPSASSNSNIVVSDDKSFSDDLVQEEKRDMSMGELLSIEPQELQIPLELKKEISISRELKNKTDRHVAFKVGYEDVSTITVPANQYQDLEKFIIPLEEIEVAIGESKRIGDGGFGIVYKGQLSERWQNRTAAIKKHDPKSYHGKDEFRNELAMLSRFHHQNIIPFIGYYDEGDHMIIVSEYATNGSLDYYLRDLEKRRSLTWIQRLQICLGAAKGLNYLHSGLGDDNRVIHRDIKSANILLDDNLEAKICDFGLSRSGPKNQPKTQLYTKAAGTNFYMDPIYGESDILRKESDVYSFGVVLFEMLSGMLAYYERKIRTDKPRTLISLVRRLYDEGLDELIDPFMKDKLDPRSFDKFKEIAHDCISYNIKERPTMEAVIERIEEALNYQVYSDDQLIDSRTVQENERDMNFGGLLDIKPHDVQFPFEPMKKTSITKQLKNKTVRHVAFKVSDDKSFSDDLVQEEKRDMSMGELLSIEPQELQFPFELKKEISISRELKNKTDSHVAFKVKTTNPNTYAALPTTGILLPRASCNVIFTIQAQKEAPHGMQCDDKYLLQSAVVSPGVAVKDITREMFNKEAGNQVEECKLDVTYASPPQLPSQVQVRKKTLSKCVKLRYADYNDDPGEYAESHQKSFS